MVYQLNNHEVFKYSHHAMATVFELHMVHEKESYAAQVAIEAFRILDIIELELSRFIDNSDISRINNMHKGDIIIIGEHAFSCLKYARKMYHTTKYAFNIGAGKLIAASKNNDINYHAEESPPANISNLEINDKDLSVILSGDSIDLDLGGVGKGYAVDYLGDILEDWSITSALIQGGQSTALALNNPPEMQGWPVNITIPDKSFSVFLHNNSLSSSGLQKGQHIVDPRTGKPGAEKKAVWVKAPTGIQSDTLSTTFMILSISDIKEYLKDNSDISCILVLNEDSVLNFGI